MHRSNRTISSAESVKILKLLEAILVPADQFRKQVQISLAQILGLHRSIFWLADAQGRLIDPLPYNVGDRLMDDYVNHFYQFDVLHPENMKQGIARDGVLQIDDILSPSEYEKTEYYKCFMYKYGYYYQMGVYFQTGNKLLGAIGMARSRNERAFTAKDARSLELIAKHIAKALADQSVVAEADDHKRLFAAQAESSPDGLIFFEPPLRIHYANSAAREICAALVGEQCRGNPVESFIRNVLSIHWGNWHMGLEKTLAASALDEVLIRILPSQPVEGQLGNHRLYAIQLMPESGACRLGAGTGGDRGLSYQLTAKEREVYSLIAKGLTNAQIADQLCISHNTVKRHLQNIYKKMNVRNRTGLCYKLNGRR